jgi:hypothetical protein
VSGVGCRGGQQRAVYMRLVKLIRAQPGMPVELAETFARLLPGA